MAVAGIEITAEVAELRELQAAIGRLFSPSDKAAILKSALEKAIEPTFQRLKTVTPLGPTGNLRRAVSKKVKTYNRDGNAVALVGFRRAGRERSQSAAGGTVRAGPDRAFHQWWLEEGTKDRIIQTVANKPYARRGHLRRVRGKPAVEVRPHRVKGQGAMIASSYNRLGPFETVPADRANGRVQTDPPYQRAFFKKGKKNQTLIIREMRPGGNTQPPLKAAWDATRSQVAEILQRELRLSLEKAVETLTRRSLGGIE